MGSAFGAISTHKRGAGGRKALRPPFACRCLPFLLLLVLCGSAFAVTTDDPFITYRYARNLLAGHGPVFNIGERVEGFSSPLHLLLCALLLETAPGVGILFEAKLCGVLFAILAVYQTGRLARCSGLRPWEALLAQTLVALNINFAVAAVNGLETAGATCVLLWTLEAFLRERRGRVRSAVLLIAALLTRPEMGLVFVALLAVRGFRAWRLGLPMRGSAGGWALLFVWLVALLTLARLAYYGEFLPNTFYAKRVPVGRGLSEGVTYLLHPLSPLPLAESAPVAWLGAAVFWLTAVVGLAARRGRMSGWALGGVVLALSGFVLRAGGDWMAGWRFLAPALPALAILQCHGLRVLARHPRPWLRPVTALAVAAVWGGCAWVAPVVSWGAARYAREDRGLLMANGPLGRKWVTTAEYIHHAVAPGRTVAYSEMGYAGWVNPGMTFCDVRGLTDREVAHLPDRFKGPFGVDDEQWFVPGDPLFRILDRRRPDVIVAFSHRGAPPRVLGRYRLVAAVRDARDAETVIVPSLVYVPAAPPPNEKPLTGWVSGGAR